MHTELSFLSSLDRVSFDRHSTIKRVLAGGCVNFSRSHREVAYGSYPVTRIKAIPPEKSRPYGQKLRKIMDLLKLKNKMDNDTQPNIELFISDFFAWLYLVIETLTVNEGLDWLDSLVRNTTLAQRLHTILSVGWHSDQVEIAGAVVESCLRVEHAARLPMQSWSHLHLLSGIDPIDQAQQAITVAWLQHIGTLSGPDPVKSVWQWIYLADFTHVPQSFMPLSASLFVVLPQQFASAETEHQTLLASAGGKRTEIKTPVVLGVRKSQ